MATWYQSTRLHDDAMRVAQQVNESQAPLKYVTFGPDYLRDRSCTTGNRGNCSVYSSLDVSKEPRIGKLTDLRNINRPETQIADKRLHIDNPDKTTGYLLNENQIDEYARLFAYQQYSKPCDINPTGNYVNNHFDRGITYPTAQASMSERILGRHEVMRSTRVERRNAWQDECNNR